MKTIKRILRFLLPPPGWRLPVSLLSGILFGIVLFGLHKGEAASYLSDSPRTCTNCHVMYPHYATWEHSPHRRHAVCNDCHVPQDNLFDHYLFKAQDGLRHSYIFTLGLEPQAIRIKEAGKNVVQDNCKRCHERLLHETWNPENTFHSAHFDSERLCWECHRDVPHGNTSLSSTPYVKHMMETKPIADWIINHLKNK